MKRIFLCVIVLMTSVVVASAQLVGILEDDVRIVRGVMPNGLVYYLVPNSSVKGYADFAFIQRNGVAMEDSSSLGLTYLMECMALTETHNFPDGAIFSFIDDMGLSRVNGLEIEAGDYHTIYSFNEWWIRCFWRCSICRRPLSWTTVRWRGESIFYGMSWLHP